jgi:Diaminopimelate decarboxylase
VCTNDAIATGVELPTLERGDLIAVLDQGAYCEAVTSDYCAVPIPGAVLVDDQKISVTRHPETYEDLMARFEIPAWLN